ncbi:MAG: ATP-binding protein [bacterium]
MKLERPFRVVITGGPCAGKTELWRLLGARFPDAVLVPEAASQLMLEGDTPERAGIEAFQERVYRRQLLLETEALRRGRFLICDRGVVDGLAYSPGILQRLGVSVEAALKRYGLVLQACVIPDSDSYRAYSGSNPMRRENHLQALELEKALGRIYASHPAYHFLWGSLEAKWAAAVQIVLGRRGLEKPELEFS